MSQRSFQTLGPVLSCALLTAVLAGCSSTTNTGMSDTSSSSSEAMMMSSASSVQAMMQSSDAMAKKYANGTFAAVGDYRSPAGAEQVSVSLTLNNGTITDAQFQGSTQNPRSKQYQDMFATGFKQAVVGKSIDQLALTVVNGSSLTPMGFMDAVAKIKTEAKAS